jgi:endo-1,4-beta-xylanase
MKNMIKLAGIAALLTGVLFAGCGNYLPEDNGPGGTDNSFVPVTNITGVRSWVVVGTVSIGGTVVPPDATNKTINWSIQPGGDTEATISGNRLTTAWEGFVIVRATVADGKAVGVDFTKNFTISVDPFVPVSHIIYNGPMFEEVGIIFLEATVYPDDASYTDIVWSIKDAGTTKATINKEVLTTKAAGTVWVTATIIDGKAQGTNYTLDFFIYITDFPSGDLSPPLP